MLDFGNPLRFLRKISYLFTPRLFLSKQTNNDLPRENRSFGRCIDDPYLLPLDSSSTFGKARRAVEGAEEPYGTFRARGTKRTSAPFLIAPCGDPDEEKEGRKERSFSDAVTDPTLQVHLRRLLPVSQKPNLRAEHWELLSCIRVGSFNVKKITKSKKRLCFRKKKDIRVSHIRAAERKDLLTMHFDKDISSSDSNSGYGGSSNVMLVATIGQESQERAAVSSVTFEYSWRRFRESEFYPSRLSGSRPNGKKYLCMLGSLVKAVHK
uniref:Uncharacterized protein n=1 Tax=Vespula pensylvanica TaxID=30213 RepID=A0A834U7V2_VESPE|nr:hypothetical protein H0235_010574 [Vespula pensylvanica]